MLAVDDLFVFQLSPLHRRLTLISGMPKSIGRGLAACAIPAPRPARRLLNVERYSAKTTDCVALRFRDSPPMIVQ